MGELNPLICDLGNTFFFFIYRYKKKKEKEKVPKTQNPPTTPSQQWEVRLTEFLTSSEGLETQKNTIKDYTKTKITIWGRLYKVTTKWTINFLKEVLNLCCSSMTNFRPVLVLQTLGGTPTLLILRARERDFFFLFFFFKDDPNEG